MKVREAIAKISNLGYFSAAKWAVAHILNADINDLIFLGDNKLSSKEMANFQDMMARLKNDEPMQYVLGKWQFVDLEIITDKRALIPRPETELLAIKAAECAKTFDRPKVYDLGCGTGCIGLYVKSQVADAEVALCDIKGDALSLAKENSEALNLSCTIEKFDILKDKIASCDVLLSNPPYIPSEDIKGLDVNVRDYEPLSALDGGGDGLAFYRALAEIAQQALSKNGVGFFEIGINQGADVMKLFKDKFETVQAIKDYNGIDRIIYIKRG